MAGPDLELPSTVGATLPLKIPSTQLNLLENNVPERLLQIYLENYNKNQAGTRKLTLIECELEEGAKTINLSATF